MADLRLPAHRACCTTGCTRSRSSIPSKVKYLDAAGYLERAYRTAIAYWTVPLQVEKWSADAVGTMNEAFIPDLIDALDEEGKTEWAASSAGTGKARSIAS